MFGGQRQSWADSTLTTSNQYWISAPYVWNNGTNWFEVETPSIVDAAGNVFIAGYGTNGQGSIIKLAPNGTPYYGIYNNITTDDHGSIEGMAVTVGGGTLFAVGCDGKPNSPGGSVLYKFNASTGAIVSTYSLTPMYAQQSGGTFSTPHLTISPSSGIAVIGTDSSATQKGIIAAFDTNLSLLWARQLSIVGLSITPEGGIYDSNSNLYVYGSINDTKDTGFLLKYNSTGILQWQRFISGPTDDYGTSAGSNITIDSSNNIYIVANPAPGDTASPVMKYDTNGTLLSAYGMSISTPSGNTFFTPYGINYDGTGNLFVGGTFYHQEDVGQPFSWGVFTSKLSTSGTSIWNNALTFGNDNITYYTTFSQCLRISTLNQTYYTTVLQELSNGAPHNSYVTSFPTDGTLTNSYAVGNVTLNYFTLSNVSITSNTASNVAGNLANTSATMTVTSNNAVTWTSFTPVITENYIGKV